MGTFVNCIEEIKDLVAISFYKRPIIKIYDSISGNYIKKIDITNVSLILGKL